MEFASRVSLRQLEYFVAVATSGSFRRAADQLGVSQPTLTSQIAALEQQLSVQLFERSRTGTAASPVGRELLADARGVLEQFRGLVDHAKELTTGPAGTYRLGVSPTLGPYLLPHVLPAIHQDFASLKFYVREDVPRRLEAALLDGQLDLILSPAPAAASNLTVVPLFRETLKLVLPNDHPLADKARVQRSDLKGQAVLTIGEEHHMLHRQMQRLCEHLGAVVRRDYEGTSLDTLRQMVVMGMGLAFLPTLYIRSEIRDGDGLRIVSLTDEAITREHALMWRPTSPARNLFRELTERIRTLAKQTFGSDITLISSTRRASSARGKLSPKADTR